MRITIETKEYQRQVFRSGGRVRFVSGLMHEVALRDASGDIIYSETAETMDTAIDRAADFREAIDQPGCALVITPVASYSMEVG